ncbi:hypothetical protein VCSRO25_0595 [Vibrio cholerae]|nr:hypothetical protein VCSRO25_0595 [Vibrio cholerae]
MSTWVTIVTLVVNITVSNGAGMSETTNIESNTTLDLKQSFALLSVDKNGIVTMKFGDEVTIFMNEKCPTITTDLLKVITSIKMEATRNQR